MREAEAKGMEDRSAPLLETTARRYLVGLAAVALAFAWTLVTPLTGTGALFVLFFTATVATSLLAGVGPGLSVLFVSLPLATYMFVLRAGYSLSEAIFQALLYAINGLLVIFLTSRVNKARRAVQRVNQQLRTSNEELTHAMDERERANDLLRESEQRLQSCLDQAPDGIYVLESESGRILNANKCAAQMLGYNRDELLQLSAADIEGMHPPIAIHATHQRAQQEVAAVEGLHRRKDGSTFPVEIRLSSLAPAQPGLLVSIVRDITERKRAEEALRGISAELRQTLYTAGTGLTHCSRDLRYLSANPAYAQYVQMPLEQIVGRPIVEVLGQQTFEIIRPRIERVLSGERVEFEDELPIAGALKCVHAIYTPDRDASDNVVGWVASVMDITVRKRIEEELKAANASLDAIIENIPVMMFMKEGQSLRFVRFNRAGEELLGWPRQQMIGKSDYDFWPQAQADFFVEKDRETLNSGKIVDIPEESIQTRYQGVRLLHTKKVPILDTAGHPTYLLGISEDITERRRIEQEQQFLAEASVLLSASLDYEHTLATVAQLVVEHIADWCAVDVMDEHGRLSRLKVASADPAKAALCAVLEQMPPNRDLPNFVRSVSEGGRPITIEHVTTEWVESFAQTPEHLQAILATGVLSLIAVPLVMRGERLGVLVFGSSTPSRVYGPGDLRAAAALADRAAVAIEHARLYRASLQATELRERVLGVVAHDLRNPLAAIRLETSLLKRRAPDPERRSQQPGDFINSVAIRMDRIIQDLLSAALIEVGELTMQPTRLSTSRLVTEAVDMQRPAASSSSVELQLDLEPDVRDIWADHDRLLQVLENLIGNAIKFTSPGGRITVGAASTGNEVLFRVADTGCGISPGDMPQIFDRFWRATERTGRVGAGLGLHITKGIVEAHGGRIWVESTLGRGSTFFFSIPRVRPAADHRADVIQPE